MTCCHIKIVYRFFIANKGVGLSLDIWPPTKAFKCLLQNIMLDLLYHKQNPFIKTLLDGSISKYTQDYNLREKC